jgi:hypothetical protein
MKSGSKQEIRREVEIARDATVEAAAKQGGIRPADRRASGSCCRLPVVGPDQAKQALAMLESIRAAL